MTTSRDTVLWDVVGEHLDEAEFLLEQWLVAARSPRFTLVQIQKTVESRLIAHLDGLAVGGQAVADELRWPALGKETDAPPLRMAAAALALLLDPEISVRDRLVDLLRTAESDALRDGLRRAFQITARTDVDEPLRTALYATDAPATQATLLDVLAARRVNPGPILGPLLRSADPRVLAAALNAGAAADGGPLQHLVEPHLTQGAADIRGAALKTALIWNLASAWKACVAEARSGSPDAMLLVALLGGPAELALLISALRSPELRGAALFALGFSGRGEAVDACLPLLDDADAKVAKLAIEAVAAITDLPLDDDLFALAPAADTGDGALPPLQEDLDVDLAPDPVDELPLLDAGKVRSWWAGRRQSYAAAQRYIRGKVVSSASIETALEEGPLRRSGPVALELAIRSGARVKPPALRLGYSKPAVPAEVALQRPPAWR